MASIINRNLSVCEQSEFGAALGVARLAMYIDKNISDTNSIIRKIEIKKSFSPNEKLINLLQKRYKIWKEIYFNGKNSSASFINL